MSKSKSAGACCSNCEQDVIRKRPELDEESGGHCQALQRIPSHKFDASPDTSRT